MGNIDVNKKIEKEQLELHEWFKKQAELLDALIRDYYEIEARVKNFERFMEEKGYRKYKQNKKKWREYGKVQI